jgi:predicted AlkP superfamily phosphohydrolase/phosphomutase
MLAKGCLPTVGKLMNGGVHGVLDSPLPPMTPVAWSSLATGKGPAKHGIYEWVRRSHDGYDFLPYATGERVGTPFWERLAEQGIRVGLVNLPLTYPPPQVNGFVVCGFDTPESAPVVTYPPDLRTEMEGLYGPYRPHVPQELKMGGNGDALFEAESRLQEQQVQVAIAMSERHDIDVLVINLMLLDHVNHYLPDFRRVEDALICTDSHLAALLEGFRPNTILLISDHGSRRIHGRFLLGLWLSDHGYHAWPDQHQMERDYLNWLLSQALQRSQGPDLREKLARRLVLEAWLRAPTRIESCLWRILQKRLMVQSHHYWASPKMDPEASQLYAGAVYGCLYLNIQGREPSGVVLPERQRELQHRVTAELSEIVDPDSGGPLFSHIYGSEELYPGTAVGQPPDLVLDNHSSHWGLSLQVPPSIMKKDGYFVRDTDVWYGEHNSEGMFVFAGEDVLADPGRGSAHILDIPSTLLHLCNTPIPDDYDGQVLTELLQPAFLSDHPVRSQPGDSAKTAPSGPEYSEVEAVELLARLRALGYVE